MTKEMRKLLRKYVCFLKGERASQFLGPLNQCGVRRSFIS